MKAKADSWTRQPFVAGIAVPYQASFTPAQFERLSAGLVPEQWDRWFVAVVHLQYPKHPETDPNPPSPGTTVFESIEEWIERGMKANHEDHMLD